MALNPSSALFRLLNAPARPGQIVWLGLRPGRREPMLAVDGMDVDPRLGIVGDRYSRAGGARQVTLIQSELLAAIASHLGRSEVRPDELRRNVVTRGINLLALKEKRFRLGAAVLETTGECHPCSRMEEILGVGGYNAARGLGGITARVAEGGFVGLSDQIVSLPPEA